MLKWPDWWSWELALSAHIEERMVDRRFNEVDLRLILEEATEYHPDVVAGRWVIETQHSGPPWEIIVEPLAIRRVVLAVTAYPVV